jgi:hypothetical protein
MTQVFDVEALIELRKQTRAISDLLRSQAADYLSTLSHLVRPQSLFGEYLQGAPRGSGRETQHNFKDFKTLYDRVGPAAPFGLINELEVPLNLLSTTPELYPLEYDIVLAQSQQRVRITSPCRWVVGFHSFELARFRKIVKDPNRSNAELYRFVTHYLILFYCFSKAGGLGRVLQGLRFPVSFERLEDFGDLPFCVISSPVRSSLPDEEVIRNSTAISGNTTFEELLGRESIEQMRDDIRERLLQSVEGA